MSTERLRSLLESAFPNASEVKVIDRGGGDHFEVCVVAGAFEGKRLVERHQMVYAALGAAVDGQTIHALALKTLTPEQAAQ